MLCKKAQIIPHRVNALYSIRGLKSCKTGILCALVMPRLAMRLAVTFGDDFEC